ncbi:MAG: flagellar export chaperone FlgN [Oscillospiraceae bacterium]
MLDYEQLVEFIKEYNAHYRELLSFETEKFSLIAADNVEALGKSLSREQALIMKSGVYEKKRFEILADEKDKTFPQIIDTCPQKYKGSLSDGYNELKRLVFQIKSINDNAREIVAHRLSILEGVSGQGGFVSSYDNGGNKLRAEKTNTLNKDV